MDTGGGIFLLVAPPNAGKSSVIFIDDMPFVTVFVDCADFFDVVF